MHAPDGLSGMSGCESWRDFVECRSGRLEGSNQTRCGFNARELQGGRVEGMPLVPAGELQGEDEIPLIFCDPAAGRRHEGPGIESFDLDGPHDAGKRSDEPGPGCHTQHLLGAGVSGVPARGIGRHVACCNETGHGEGKDLGLIGASGREQRAHSAVHRFWSPTGGFKARAQSPICSPDRGAPVKQKRSKIKILDEF